MQGRKDRGKTGRARGAAVTAPGGRPRNCGMPQADRPLGRQGRRGAGGGRQGAPRGAVPPSRARGADASLSLSLFSRVCALSATHLCASPRQACRLAWWRKGCACVRARPSLCVPVQMCAPARRSRQTCESGGERATAARATPGPFFPIFLPARLALAWPPIERAPHTHVSIDCCSLQLPQYATPPSTHAQPHPPTKPCPPRPPSRRRLRRRRPGSRAAGPGPVRVTGPWACVPRRPAAMVRDLRTGVSEGAASCCRASHPPPRISSRSPAQSAWPRKHKGAAASPKSRAL